jgi:hypothetical protein
VGLARQGCDHGGAEACPGQCCIDGIDGIGTASAVVLDDGIDLGRTSTLQDVLEQVRQDRSLLLLDEGRDDALGPSCLGCA